MYEETYLKKDAFRDRYKTKMCIESIDNVTSYSNDRQNLKFAVTVLNPCGEPISKSEVDLVVSAPDGSKFSLSKQTDSEGVAMFELFGIERGRWEAVVFKITHPEYVMSLNHRNQRWSVTYV
jgi:hypothetical protein